jgi:hypothetical protein
MESNQANRKIVVTTDAYLPPEGTKTGSRAGRSVMKMADGRGGFR